MDEFIKKLIERLEEKQNDVAWNLSLNAYYSDGYYSGIEYAIEIVNELAEEYINTSTEHINCSTDRSTDNQKLECRCKDCIHWSDMVAGATEHVRLCTVGGYMVGQNGYCVYGEKRLPAPYTEGE